MCIVISENLTETYLIVVISILFSGKPFIRCFQNHCYSLALNAYPLAGSHHSTDLHTFGGGLKNCGGETQLISRTGAGQVDGSGSRSVR